MSGKKRGVRASELEVFPRGTKQIENEAIATHTIEKHIPALKTPSSPS